MTSKLNGGSALAAVWASLARTANASAQYWTAARRRGLIAAGAASAGLVFSQSATAQQADLQIVKTLTPTQYTVGTATNVTYTVTVTNNSTTGTFVD